MTENSQELAKKLSSVSEKRAKENAGYIMKGREYANRVINIIKLMEDEPMLKDLFRFNDFISEIEYDRAPIWDKRIKPGKKISDTDEIYIKGWLAREKHFEPPRGLISEALFLSSVKKIVHPVKEYLESLKWDGTKRLDNWMHKVCGAEDNIYTNLVSRKMICAMIKRIYDPGCQFDNLVVLEGREGIYKTTMLRILGGKWYAPFSIKADSKDAVDIMQGKWLLEMEELATLKISETEHVDSFLSRTVDRVRLSYRRNAQDFPRQCIFVGSMNPIGDNQYLKKQSENRRFWPIECKNRIDIDWIKDNRDQLFAEGMTIYENEFLDLDNEEAINICVGKLEDRKTYDAWIDIINEWLTGKSTVAPHEILTTCLGFSKEKINHSNMVRVGICMRKLKWLPRKFGVEQKKYYVRPDADVDMINEGLQEIFDE